MGATRAKVTVGTEIPPLVKHMTQAKMNIFSGGLLGGFRAGIHTSPEVARASLSMESPIASGRMSLGYAAEALRRFFGPEVFHSTGSVDLRFIRPVLDGDTVTVRGRVTEVKPEGQGERVTLEMWCENQNGEKTALGAGNALVPG